jgi:hypothetical protein
MRIMWEQILAWISGIGTLGTLLIAIRLLWDHHRDRKVLLAERKSAVARKISAWCDSAGEVPVLYVQNLSDEPVYDLVAYVGRMDADLTTLPGPTNRYIEPVFGIIPPNAKLDFKIADRDLIEGSHFPDLPAIALEFTDPNGVFWRRESDGLIHETRFRRPFD